MNEIRLPKESSARQSCRRRRNYIEGRQSIYVFFSFLTLTFLFRCHFGVSMLASSSLGRLLLLLAALPHHQSHHATSGPFDWEILDSKSPFLLVYIDFYQFFLT